MSKEFIVLTWGGIGDLLLCTPALKALKENYPDHRVVIYYSPSRKKHKLVLANNPYVDAVRMLSYRTLWRYPYHLYLYLFRKDRVGYYSLHFQHIPPTWIYKKSNKEIIADIFNIKLQDKNLQLFFSDAEEQKAMSVLRPYSNVIIMHIYSRTSKNHLWDNSNWEQLVSTLPGYTFIQIGDADEPRIKGAVDWRGKVGLRDAFCLLKYATSFVGVESCFAHATNAVGLPGVVLFGDTSPLSWGHDNNINIYKKLPCSPCYYYLWGSDCPYDNQCMKLITVEEVKEALIQQVNKRKSVRRLINETIQNDFFNE